MIKKLLAFSLNLVLPLSLAYCAEDLTTFTEVDVNSTVTVATSSVTWASTETRDDNSYLYRDETSIGDFEYQSKLKVTATDSQTGTVIVGLTDTIGGYGTWTEGLHLNWLATTGNPARLRVSTYNFSANDTSINLSLNTDYWLTTTRSGTTFQCVIYSDSGRTTVVDTISVTVSSSTFQYLYVFASRDINSTGHQQSGVHSDFEIISGSGYKVNTVQDPAKVNSVVPAKVNGVSA